MSSPHPAPDPSGAENRTDLSEVVEATAAALVEPGSDPAGAIRPAADTAADTAAPADRPVTEGSGLLAQLRCGSSSWVAPA